MKLLIFGLLTVYCIITDAAATDLGLQTYQIACKNCHAPVVSVGIKAPAAFDIKAWDNRFSDAMKQSEQDPKKFPTALDYLLYRASIGKGLMPHGGLCHETDVTNKNCSNEALKAAILYMSQKKVLSQ